MSGVGPLSQGIARCVFVFRLTDLFLLCLFLVMLTMTLITRSFCRASQVCHHCSNAYFCKCKQKRLAEDIVGCNQNLIFANKHLLLNDLKIS
ncbi:hypothetical protein Leryth_007211 [Lithospermum erythrorhizon]|nr:hypothetical protein Leryth_007211 [Lithospermum erythrorhizon]